MAYQTNFNRRTSRVALSLLTCAVGVITISFPLNQHAYAKAQQASTKSKQDAALALSNAETINIKVPEYRVLSGEYRIGADGSVALPGLGRLTVSNLSVTEFEGYIRSEIYRRSNREVNVAIEIAKYRSVFVSGAVIRSGAFPWKPGFSVLHAQALAGGIARPRSRQLANAILGASGSSQSNNRISYDLAASLATIERLRIERKGGSVFVLPKRVFELVSEEEATRLASRQQALLDSRGAALQSQIRALQNAKLLATNEIGALEAQRVRIEDQLAGRRSMRKRIERLLQQGYSRADRVFEAQIRIAALEERLTTTTLGITRVSMAKQEAEHKLETLIKERTAKIDLELLDLEQTVGRLEIGLGRRPQTENTKKIDQSAILDVQPRYEIVRIIDGNRIVISADRTTDLRPGDVLVVSLPS